MIEAFVSAGEYIPQATIYRAVFRLRADGTVREVRPWTQLPLGRRPESKSDMAHEPIFDTVFIEKAQTRPKRTAK